MGFAKEFREFAVKGNVIDLAVGIIIGAAFTKIVSSLVNDIIMPPVGLLVGNLDFSHMAIILREKAGDAPDVAIRYGQFINNIVDFLIVALAIFLVIRQINRLKRPENAVAADPTTKLCSFCQTTIPVKASRCPHCTSQLEPAATK